MYVLYSTTYPVRWTGQSALHFTRCQTYSFRHKLNFSGVNNKFLLHRSAWFALYCEYQTANVRRKQIQLLSDSKDVLILESRHYSVSRRSVQTRSRRKTRKGRVEITVAPSVTEDHNRLNSEPQARVNYRLYVTIDSTGFISHRLDHGMSW